ncbi:hypothetical protein BgiBS90_036938, partial [Biomphalaria glabrata]
QPYVTAPLRHSSPSLQHTTLKIRYVVTAAFVVAAQRHNATTSQLHYVLALLHHSATTSQRHYVTAPLHHSITTSQHHYVKDYSCLCRSSPTSQRHYVTASPRHSATTSMHHYVTAPLWWNKSADRSVCTSRWGRWPATPRG